MPIYCRGIRGATTVTDNSREAILEATRELLDLIITANQLDVADVCSVFFTTTSDINVEYPAVAARELGWHDVALMCSHEMAVPTGLAKCLRVLIHWNTTKSQHEITHIYIKDAERLRPERKHATTSR